MSVENKVIKLNSISRQMISGHSYIVLDKHQDSLTHVHTLLLFPVEKKRMNNGRVNGVGLLEEPFKLTTNQVGRFPITFEMDMRYGYLVLGIVSKNVIADFKPNQHLDIEHASTSTKRPTGQQSCHDSQIARNWIENHHSWVRNKGIVIYA